MDYPSACKLCLDGHYAGCIFRLSEKPVKFRHGVVSNSSFAPFLFSPLVVTGKKAILLLELIMNGLDDDTYLDASPSASIGEIKFDIFRTTVPIKKKGGRIVHVSLGCLIRKRFTNGQRRQLLIE